LPFNRRAFPPNWHGIGYTHSVPSNLPPSKKILIIDDDPSIRYMLSRVLVGEGYQTSSAADGESGVSIATKMEPDLVLLDLKMPGVGGRETLKSLMVTYPDIPVIVITAVSPREFGSLAGVNALLQKPLDFPTLLDTIQRLLAETVEPG
jgi:CheY-like chemotaxis protein